MQYINSEGLLIDTIKNESRICGITNTLSGDAVALLGRSNTVGASSLTFQGNNNTVSSNSVLFGGEYNNLSESFLLKGSNNSLSDNSILFQGTRNTLSASLVINGENNYLSQNSVSINTKNSNLSSQSISFFGNNNISQNKSLSFYTENSQLSGGLSVSGRDNIVRNSINIEGNNNTLNSDSLNVLGDSNTASVSSVSILGQNNTVNSKGVAVLATLSHIRNNGIAVNTYNTTVDGESLAIFEDQGIVQTNSFGYGGNNNILRLSSIAINTSNSRLTDNSFAAFTTNSTVSTGSISIGKSNNADLRGNSLGVYNTNSTVSSNSISINNINSTLLGNSLGIISNNVKISSNSIEMLGVNNVVSISSIDLLGSDNVVTNKGISVGDLKATITNSISLKNNNSNFTSNSVGIAGLNNTVSNSSVVLAGSGINASNSSVVLAGSGINVSNNSVGLVGSGNTASNSSVVLAGSGINATLSSVGLAGFGNTVSGSSVGLVGLNNTVSNSSVVLAGSAINASNTSVGLVGLNNTVSNSSVVLAGSGINASNSSVGLVGLNNIVSNSSVVLAGSAINATNTSVGLVGSRNTVSNSSVVLAGSGINASNSSVVLAGSGINVSNNSVGLVGSGNTASNSSVVLAGSGINATNTSVGLVGLNNIISNSSVVLAGSAINASNNSVVLAGSAINASNTSVGLVGLNNTVSNSSVVLAGSGINASNSSVVLAGSAINASNSSVGLAGSNNTVSNSSVVLAGSGINATNTSVGLVGLNNIISNSSVVLAGSGINASNSSVVLAGSAINASNSSVVLAGSAINASNNSVVLAGSAINASNTSVGLVGLNNTISNSSVVLAGSAINASNSSVGLVGSRNIVSNSSVVLAGSAINASNTSVGLVGLNNTVSNSSVVLAGSAINATNTSVGLVGLNNTVSNSSVVLAGSAINATNTSVGLVGLNNTVSNSSVVLAGSAINASNNSVVLAGSAINASNNSVGLVGLNNTISNTSVSLVGLNNTISNSSVVLAGSAINASNTSVGLVGLNNTISNSSAVLAGSGINASNSSVGLVGLNNTVSNSSVVLAGSGINASNSSVGLVGLNNTVSNSSVVLAGSGINVSNTSVGLVGFDNAISNTSVGLVGTRNTVSNSSVVLAGSGINASNSSVGLVGSGNTASNSSVVLAGSAINATNASVVLVGNRNTVSNSSVVLAGSGINASNFSVGLVGSNNIASNSSVVLAGSGINASNSSVVLAGSGINASNFSVVLNSTNSTATLSSLIISGQYNTIDNNSVGLGSNNTKLSQTRSLAVGGNNIDFNASESLAVGGNNIKGSGQLFNSSVSGNNIISVGGRNNTLGNNSISIGGLNNQVEDYSVFIGGSGNSVGPFDNVTMINVRDVQAAESNTAYLPRSFFTGNVTVRGNLSASGNVTSVDTLITTEWVARLVNYLQTSAVLYLDQRNTLGNYNIAEFNYLGSPKLFVTRQGVGINTSSVPSPYVLTFNGSASGASLSLNDTLTFGSNSDTNLYRSTTNTLKTDDSLVVAGNVGIGTDYPSTKLHIQGSSEILRITDGTRTIYAGCDTNNPWIGTSTNHDFRLVTNATEKLRITTDGRVGIGTSSPSTVFDVVSSSNGINSTWQGGTNFVELFANNNNFSEQAIAFQETGANVGAKIGVKNTGNGAYDIIFANRLNTSSTSSMTERMRITHSGNVGIGTANPDGKLNIVSTAPNDATPEFRIDGSNGWMMFHNSSTAASWNPLVQAGDKSLIFSSGVVDGTSGMVFGPHSNSNKGIRIDSNGSVGVGAVPLYKFHVSDSNSNVYIGHNIEELATGSNNGGAVYFGPNIDSNPANPTAGIESSWGGSTNPQIHLGVSRDGSKTRYSAFYDNTLKLYTADQERMIVNSKGNVGIGTTNPINYTDYVTQTMQSLSGAIVTLGRSNAIRSEWGDTPNEVYVKVIDNNRRLWFGTNNTETMTIAANGNVGIRTLTPNAALTINGGLSSNSQIYTRGLTITPASSSDTIPDLTLASPNNSLDVTWFYNNLTTGSYNPLSQIGDKGIIFSTGLSPGEGNMIIGPWSSAQRGIVIDGINGRVGINKRPTLATFDVNGTLGTSGNAFISGGSVFIGRQNSTNEGGEIQFARAFDNSNDWSIDSFGSTSTPDLRFFNATAPSVKMFINGSTGNVGIGNFSVASFPLSLGATIGNKIGLYDAGSGNGFGFGIQNGILQIFSQVSASRVGIGYGNSSAFTETLTVKGSSVGIGNTDPSALLSFPNTISTRKITLYDTFNNNNQFYGFGVENNTLVYSVDNPSASHVFFSGATATTRKELLKITGEGELNLSSGDINLSNNYGLSWSANSDGATIKFESTADSTGNSKLILETFDNGDEPIVLRQQGANRLFVGTGGRVGISNSSPAAQLDVSSLTRDEPVLFLKAPGGTAGNRSILGFWSTFVSSGNNDTGIRRTADIVAGYSVNNWGNEYLAFNVGGATDAANLTTERMRLNAVDSLVVKGMTLSSTLASVSNLFQATNSNGNGNTLKIFQYRHTAGTSWDSASTKIMNITDESNQAYIEFNPPGNPWGMAFGTGGTTERMRIQSDGKVGIGTDAPGCLLDVYANSNVFHAKIGGNTGVIRFAGQTGSGAAIDSHNPATNTARDLYLQTIGGKVGIGTDAPNCKLQVAGSSGISRSVGIDTREIKFRSNNVAHFSIYGAETGESYLSIRNTSSEVTPGIAGTTLLAVHSDGNVGIGTTTPIDKLSVNGPIYIDGGTSNYTGHNNVVDGGNRTNTYLALGPTGSNNDWAYLRQIGGDNNYHLSIDLHDDGDVAQGGQAFSIRNIASSSLDPDPTPATRFHINNIGDVGIGKNDPSYKLDVAGEALIQGWLRTTGNHGWYSQTYGGGWYMSDTSWIRTYNEKNVWTGSGLLGSQGGLTVGWGGITPATNGAIIKGDVGIGQVTNPTARLHIRENAVGTNSRIHISSEQDVQMMYSTDREGVIGWSFGQDASDSNKFKIANWFNNLQTNTRLTIDNSGRVGIGTSSPWSNTVLDVRGNLVRIGTENTAYGYLQLGASDTTTKNWHIGTESGDDSLRIWSGAWGSGTERLRFDSSGRVIFAAAGSATNPTVSVNTSFGGTAMGMYDNGGHLRFGVAGSERFRIQNDGGCVGGYFWSTGRYYAAGSGGAIGVNDEGYGSIFEQQAVSTGDPNYADGHAAYMTFHRPGRYAVKFGLDTDNNLRVGGWSMGNVSYPLMMSGRGTGQSNNSVYIGWSSDYALKLTVDATDFSDRWPIRTLQRSPVAQTASFTATNDHHGRVFNITSACTITLPVDCSEGTSINVIRNTASAVEFVAGTSASIVSTPNNTFRKLAFQNSVATAYKLSNNVWLLAGDLLP